MKDSTTYVALDAHKKQHTVAMLLPDARQPEQWTVCNSAREIKRMVRRVGKQAPGAVEFCYEAGVCGFALQRRIEAAGATCRVIAPSLVPVKPGERIKTDRRDAKKLVGMFRAGLLTEVHPPSEREESARDLCRCREAANQDLGRVRHQLSKFLLRRGLVYRDGRQWTQKHLRWVEGLRFESARDQWILGEYLAELRHRQDRLASLTRAVEAAAKEAPWNVAVGWLRCFRGIDTVTAMTTVLELHGVERFSSARQLMSYLGMTPSEESSGERERKGEITKAGNGRVRRVLMEASWHQTHPPQLSEALRKRREGQPGWVIALADQAMKRLYQRYWRLVHRGKLPTKAVTAVCREFVGFIWAVLYLQDRAVVRTARPRAARPKAPPPAEPRRVTAREFFAGKG
jgi:transposase